MESILLFTLLASREQSSDNASLTDGSPSVVRGLNQQVARQETSNEDSKSPRPYLYKCPLTLPENGVVENSPLPFMGAIIVFNLGLVYQLQTPSSIKASQFYEIANVLMDVSLQEFELDGYGGDADDDDDGLIILRSLLLLQVALTNNFGVWSYENGNMQTARSCLHRLMLMVKTFDAILPRTLTAGVQSNIRCFSSCCYKTSPF
jgi:hypothetical protein